MELCDTALHRRHSAHWVYFLCCRCCARKHSSPPPAAGHPLASTKPACSRNSTPATTTLCAAIATTRPFRSALSEALAATGHSQQRAGTQRWLSTLIYAISKASRFHIHPHPAHHLPSPQLAHPHRSVSNLLAHRIQLHLPAAAINCNSSLARQSQRLSHEAENRISAHRNWHQKALRVCGAPVADARCRRRDVRCGEPRGGTVRGLGLRPAGRSLLT